MADIAQLQQDLENERKVSQQLREENSTLKLEVENLVSIS